MWPRKVDWRELRFGAEIEFVEGDPKAVELLPGWEMALDERQVDETGCESGSELKPPPLRWQDREQIREMLARLRTTGARANWSCGLHVHVGLEPWGRDIVLPLIEAALSHQDSLRSLLRTGEDRLVYCPPVLPAMRDRYVAHPDRSALVHRGRPHSHRCGINAAAWFDFGTVEIRFANGSLTYDEVAAVIELCLRFVAAVGAGTLLPRATMLGGECPLPPGAGGQLGFVDAAGPAGASRTDRVGAADRADGVNAPRAAAALAEALGAPIDGYPPPQPAPLWYRQQVWLEEALIPVLEPIIKARMTDGEIHSIRPTPSGFRVFCEEPDCSTTAFLLVPRTDRWEVREG